ncbi:MAG: hypothetical protein JRH18_16940 [Deltaproteobacteria bacterium]|nr:hypothetical protein [Deltaproteobacteria bacterium]MBW1963383.1 hypothetical protein [Deltaproteobacteria bacterium]MBW1993402.1 hypothetical protein [Deltaproteobacteria bacterium]MBW2153344.1 hypothetical protein [Deltaproteobacteria bacterium]
MTRKLRRFLYTVAVLTCVLGFVFPNKHPHFPWQKVPVYDAVFGFLGSVLIIVFAKWLGHRWIMRDEDYYG